MSADPQCICDPFTDPDADNPACPNCHPEPSADCYIDTLPLSDRLADPDAHARTNGNPDPDAESDPESYAAPAY